MDSKTHWENVYASKAVKEVSWYRQHLEQSLRLIATTGVHRDAAIIDIGGGASTLVDDLLDQGFGNLTVLDISASALANASTRLGNRAQQVNWLEADITKAVLPQNHFDLWHDRAVFHFLTEPEDRRRYVEQVRQSLKPGGHIIVASFGPNGPLRCSGLEVVRYNPDELHTEFGDEFHLVESVAELHQTPFDTTQEFVYCYCRKSAERKVV